MNISHITSHSLRRLLSLTEKKEQLIKGIEDVETEISKTLKGVVTSVVEAAEAVTPFKPKAKKGAKKAKATRSGGLKDRIIALLEAAGDQGLRVKEIAQKLSSKPANISVWFSTTGKKHATKVEPGRYALKGSARKPVATAAKPAKAKKKKSNMSPEGRAKLAAMMKARWAARRAGKPAKKKSAKA
ncbi:MAG: hypothetical protein WCQ16_05145 [Verrucomicrobiae bacterium]